MMSRLMTPREQLVIGFIGLAAVVGSATALWMNRDRVASTSDDRPPADEVAAIAEPAAPAPNTVVTVNPVEPQPSVTVPAQIVVSVRGAVERPGVYTMDISDRVIDLIGQAGGLLDSAEIDDINLAAKLIDGSTLSIPGAGAQMRDGVVTLRRRAADTANNPPQYTVSGWDAAGATPAVAPVPGPVSAGLPLTPAPTENNDPRTDLNQASAAQLADLPGIGPGLAQAIIDYRTSSPFKSVDQLQNVRGIGPKRYEAIRDLVTVSP